MKRWTLVGAVLLLTLTAVAGKKIALKDLSSRTFAASGIAAVKPLAEPIVKKGKVVGTDGQYYAKISTDWKRIVKCSFRDGKEVATLFDVATVKGDKLQYVEDYLMSPDGQHMLIQTNTMQIYRHSFTATYYIYSLSDNSIVPLSKNGDQQTPLWSPDGRQIAFVRDNNIFLTTIGDVTEEVQVTHDGRRNEVINGIPDWVNEEEFGNDRAMVFSADGRQLVWVRYDESAVKQYSMSMFKGLYPEYVDYADYPGFYTYKYPIAGEDNAKVSVWSYDIASRQKHQLQVPLDADGYIPRIIPVDSRVAVCTLNRHQDCMRIYMVNPVSTEAQLIIEETIDKYVREDAYVNLKITERHILLPSDRDGWMHLYLYDLNGRLVRRIDSGNYEVSEVYGFDEKTGDTYFASHESGATDQRVWVAHKNGKRECLTPIAGWSSATFSTDCKYFIHTWSNLNTPPVYTLCDNKGRVLLTLENNQELQLKLLEYEMGTRELFTLTTADGIQLNGWVVKPIGFDAAKRYPVVMYQYGGPGNQQVADRWNIGMAGKGALLEQYLCQQGYVCVCVDNRGTGGRGADFEKCTYLRLGQLEAHDQVEAALWLGRQSWVDPQRIAIWGWSFGGFNTLMSMSEGRAVFRCGVAIAPPTSWRYYDTIYTERFMRTPQENPSGYDECPISRVSKLHGALLLCHGMADDNVHFRNTAEYTEELVQADKDFRQLVYTNRNHSIYGGNTRNHLYRQCISFFKKEL